MYSWFIFFWWLNDYWFVNLFCFCNIITDWWVLRHCLLFKVSCFTVFIFYLVRHYHIPIHRCFLVWLLLGMNIVIVLDYRRMVLNWHFLNFWDERGFNFITFTYFEKAVCFFTWSKYQSQNALIRHFRNVKVLHLQIFSQLNNYTKLTGIKDIKNDQFREVINYIDKLDLI